MPKNLIIAQQLEKLGFGASKAPKADSKVVKYSAQQPHLKKKQALLNSVSDIDESELPKGWVDSVINAKTIAEISQLRKLVMPKKKVRKKRVEAKGGKRNFFKLIYTRMR